MPFNRSLKSWLLLQLHVKWTVRIPFTRRSLKSWCWVVERKKWHADMCKVIFYRDLGARRTARWLQQSRDLDAVPILKVTAEYFPVLNTHGVIRSWVIRKTIHRPAPENNIEAYREWLNCLACASISYDELVNTVNRRRGITNWLGISVVDEPLLSICKQMDPLLWQEDLEYLAYSMPRYSKIRRLLRNWALTSIKKPLPAHVRQAPEQPQLFFLGSAKN